MRLISKRCGDWGIVSMDKLKLQWKIFAYLLGFCFLLLSILWVFQTLFLSDMYKMIRTAEVKEAIALVEENIDSPTLQEVFRDLERAKEITVRPTNEFIRPVDPVPARPDHRLPETITKVHEFVRKDGTVLSLTFYAMITPVEATVSTLQVQLLMITGIIVFLATALAIIISRRIAKPIEQINQSAKALGSGHYDAAFNGTGYREICELSGTLNHAASELSKVDRMRRELMANISHDLRTPLTFLYSYAEMMHDFPDEITPEHTQVIMEETERLTSLVSDVLDISTLEAGGPIPCKARYDLTESLQKVVDRMQELVRGKGYELVFESTEKAFIEADEGRISQAFYNLLLNAITYCGEDRAVVVTQHVSEDRVRIEVADHGEGISKADLPYIWDRYYKVDHHHKRPVAGTGLGLSIVRKIIDMHEGQCGVVSEEGTGSTFWFEIGLCAGMEGGCEGSLADGNVFMKTN